MSRSCDDWPSINLSGGLKGGHPEHFLANALVAPGVALETLATDPDDVHLGDDADFQFERELGPQPLRDPASQGVPSKRR